MMATDPITSSPHPAVLFPSSQVERASLALVGARERHDLAPLTVNLAYVSMPRPMAVERIDRPGCPRVVTCDMDSRRAQHRLDQCRCDMAMTRPRADPGSTWAS